MMHHCLKVSAACLCLAGAGLLIGSIFDPHVLLIANKEPPRLPIFPDVSVWIGFLQGESILTLGSLDPVVTTFHYEKSYYCSDVCTSLKNGGIFAVVTVCVAAGLLVASATISLVSLTPLVGKVQPPVIGSAGRHGATPSLFLWARKLSGLAALVICVGLSGWFMILHDVRKGKPSGGSKGLMDVAESPDFGLDKDHRYAPGTSALMLMGALASSVLSAVILTMANVYERLYLSEGAGDYQSLP